MLILTGENVTGRKYCEGCRYFEPEFLNDYDGTVRAYCEHENLCKTLVARIKEVKNDTD